MSTQPFVDGVLLEAESLRPNQTQPKHNRKKKTLRAQQRIRPTCSDKQSENMSCQKRSSTSWSCRTRKLFTRSSCCHPTCLAVLTPFVNVTRLPGSLTSQGRKRGWSQNGLSQSAQQSKLHRDPTRLSTSSQCSVNPLSTSTIGSTVKRTFSSFSETNIPIFTALVMSCKLCHRRNKPCDFFSWPSTISSGPHLENNHAHQRRSRTSSSPTATVRQINAKTVGTLTDPHIFNVFLQIELSSKHHKSTVKNPHFTELA